MRYYIVLALILLPGLSGCCLHGDWNLQLQQFCGCGPVCGGPCCGNSCTDCGSECAARPAGGPAIAKGCRRAATAAPIAVIAQHSRFHPVPTRGVFEARPVSYEAPVSAEPEPAMPPTAEPPAKPKPVKPPMNPAEGEEVPPPATENHAQRAPARTRVTTAPPPRTTRVRILAEEAAEPAPIQVSSRNGLNWRPYR